MEAKFVKVFSKNFLRILSFIFILPTLCLAGKKEKESEDMAMLSGIGMTSAALIGAYADSPKTAIIGSGLSDLTRNFMDDDISDKEKLLKAGLFASQAYCLRDNKNLKKLEGKELLAVTALRIFSAWSQYKSVQERNKSKNKNSKKESTWWKVLSSAARSAADCMSLDGGARIIPALSGIYEVYRDAQELNPEMFKTKQNDICSVCQYDIPFKDLNDLRIINKLKCPSCKKLMACEKCFDGLVTDLEKENAGTSHPLVDIAWAIREAQTDEEFGKSAEKLNLEYDDFLRRQCIVNIKENNKNEWIKYFEAQSSSGGNTLWWRWDKNKNETYFIRKPKCPLCNYQLPRSYYDRNKIKY